MKHIEIKWYSNLNFDNAHGIDTHENGEFEANIVTKGRVEFTATDKTVRLCPGDMVIWSPDNNRCLRVISNNETEFTAIRFDYNGKGIDKNSFKVYRLSHNSSLLSRILVEEIVEKNGTVTEIANEIFEAIFLRCLRENIDLSIISNNSSATIYRDAITYMNNNINVMLSVPEIAHNCGICETTLKNAFKHHTGKSVKKYYSDLKTAKASELLQKGINAKEVAAILGFSTLSYFSQFFKRETGCSIRDYLKNNNLE